MYKYALMMLLVAPWASAQVVASVSDDGDELAEGLRKCRAIRDSVVRLDCYDRVAFDAGTQPEEPAAPPEEPAAPPEEPAAPPEEPADVEVNEEPAPPPTVESVAPPVRPQDPVEPTPNDRWILTTETSPFDGTTTTLAKLPAAQASGGRGGSIALVLMCQSDEIRIAIDWGEYLRNASPTVTTRVDSRPQSTAKWSRASDKETSVYKPTGSKKTREERTLRFALELQNARKLAARVVPSGGTSITAIFELAGARAALKSVRQACGW